MNGFHSISQSGAALDNQGTITAGVSGVNMLNAGNSIAQLSASSGTALSSVRSAANEQVTNIDCEGGFD